MGFPYDAAFLALLAVYLVYSVWQHLDPRFPILAALILLVVTALVDAVEPGPKRTPSPCSSSSYSPA